MHQSETARHLHIDHFHRLDIVLPENLRQFLAICFGVVEFGTANNQCPPGEKFAMKIGKGKRNAVGGYDKVGPLEVRRKRGHKMQLHRPVAQRGRCCFGITGGGACGLLRLERLRRRTRTSAGKGVRFLRGSGLLCLLFGQMMLDGLLVELFGFALLNGKRALRALAQAVAKSVAINLAYQARLSVDNLYRPFRA